MMISVLIAVYNAEKTIKKAIESILNQTYQDIEIIIIDDKCTDNTIKIINEIGDPRIKVYTNEKNVGQIKSLNKGIEYCSGKYVARMDADDISLPNRFKLQLDEFTKDPKLMMVGTSGYKTLPSGKIKKLTALPRSVDALRFYSMYRNPINHISVMIRKDFLKPPNIYNDSFMISTDWELWSRYLISGVKMKILKDRCVNYLVSDISYSEVNSKTKLSENIIIIRNNVLQYSGIQIDENEALDIILLHYFDKFSPKIFIKRLRLWNKISLKFQYQNRLHFYYAYAYDIALVLLKVFRLLYRKNKAKNPKN
jgi:glycosyltransferase involved in cell wall biosynthesis